MKLKLPLLTLLFGLVVLSFGCQTVMPPVSEIAPPPAKMETVQNAQQMVPSPLQAALLMGRQYEQEAKYAEAIEIFEGIVREQGNIPVALHRLGVIYSKTGQTELAQKYLSLAVSVDPQNAELLADFGYLTFVNGDIQGAEQSYLAALNVDPNLKRAHNNLGVILAKTNRLQLARQHFGWAGNNEAAILQNMSLATKEKVRPKRLKQVSTPMAMPTPMPKNVGEFTHLRNTFTQDKKSEQAADSVAELEIAQTAYWQDATEEKILPLLIDESKDIVEPSDCDEQIDEGSVEHDLEDKPVEIQDPTSRRRN